jgi:hypothetical protein
MPSKRKFTVTGRDIGPIERALLASAMAPSKTTPGLPPGAQAPNFHNRDFTNIEKRIIAYASHGPVYAGEE